MKSGLKSYMKLLSVLLLILVFSMLYLKLSKYQPKVVYHEMKSEIYSDVQLKEASELAVSKFKENHVVIEISYAGDEYSEKSAKEDGSYPGMLFEVVVKNRKEKVPYYGFVEMMNGEYQLNSGSVGPIQASLDYDKL